MADGRPGPIIPDRPVDVYRWWLPSPAGKPSRAARRIDALRARGGGRTAADEDPNEPADGSAKVAADGSRGQECPGPPMARPTPLQPCRATADSALPRRSRERHRR